MAFVDNPTIATLVNHLGMGGLFASPSSPTGYGDPGIGGVSDGTPSQNSSGIKPGASKPNIPEYKNRPYIPRNEDTSSSGRGSRPGGNPVAPGVMDQQTLLSPEVQKLLGQYGVHPTDTPPDPNLFVHNPQAFAKHPVLSGLLEHGMRGLAYAHPGDNFFESLIGGVKGIQEGDAASAQQVNNQLTAPFQQAGLVAQLQHMSDEHATAQATVDYHTQLIKNAQDKIAAARDRAAQAKPVRNPTTGQMMVPQPDPDNPDGPLKWKANDDDLGDPELANKNAFFTHAMNAAAQLHGGDPSQITDEERQAIEDHWLTGQSKAKSAGAIEVRKTPTTSIHIGSGSGRPGAPKIAPGDAKEYSRLTAEQKQINKNISTPVGSYFHDDQGKLIVSGSKAHKAYAEQAQQRLNAIQQRQTEIENSGRSTPSATPQAPPIGTGNPFTQQVTPSTNSNPFRR